MLDNYQIKHTIKMDMVVFLKEELLQFYQTGELCSLMMVFYMNMVFYNTILGLWH